MPSGAVVVFTRDLRVSDHPALAHAVRDHDVVVPLFVFDDAILRGAFNRPNRTGFLLESLADLDAALRTLGGRLVTRRGDWVDSVLRVARDVGAATVHVSDDASRYASARLARLETDAAAAGIRVRRTPGVAVVEPGTITPGDAGDHYKAFTPYFRRWSGVRRRAVVATPRRIDLPPVVDPGALPALGDLVAGDRSPDVVRGGARPAHEQLAAWVARGLRTYPDRHDDLPGDATSRLSPYLHFGCVSPLEVARAAGRHKGAEAFLRQLCWRDFYLQVLAARPDAAWSDYHSRGDQWRDDAEGLEAWQEGCTGYPVVDAAMRQLRQEGWMHNRARLIVASFLTKDLYIDWRVGARHFLDLLLDGDIANNNLNWQWVAGTGTDTNPHRVFNPTVQGTRFDPEGEYVRRYVPELRAVKGGAVHDPETKVRRAYDYPDPIVDHREAIAEYRDRRRS
jgi:deoxyribodipyrimidine photo-lyase